MLTSSRSGIAQCVCWCSAADSIVVSVHKSDDSSFWFRCRTDLPLQHKLVAVRCMNIVLISSALYSLLPANLDS